MRILNLLAIPLFFTTSIAFAGAPTLERCFSESAQRWGIPVGLLKAIAQEASDGFHNIPDPQEADQDHPKIFGIMGLRNDPVLGRSLLEAVQLSGHPLEELIQNPCANIDGAAAVLSKELKRNNFNMANALAHFWNSESPREVADGIREVSRILHEGSRGRIALAPNMVLSSLLASEFQAEAERDLKFAKGATQEQSRGETDYASADWDASENFTPNDINPRYIVMHTTEGSFSGAVSWLKSKKSDLSAHYVIRKSDGYVKQLVRERDRAYHARCWNVEAIGVELEGYAKDSSSFNKTLLSAAAKLVQDIANRHGIQPDDLHVIGHDFGDTPKIKQTPLQRCNSHGDPGTFFPWEKFLAMFVRIPDRGISNGPEPRIQEPAPPSQCSWWQFWCR